MVVWQYLAEERLKIINEQGEAVQAQERAKACIKEQRDQVNRERYEPIVELQKDKAWIERQASNWGRLAEKKERDVGKRKGKL